ncbi:MAG: nuclear transport factor 2 family protein [Actinomycetota bacterium]|nr:nuclear transport factor 2 family protein [Actinomycetota bacterium]
MGANADLVRTGWEAFGRGDIDGAVATTDDSAQIVVPKSIAWGGTYSGPDGFKEMIGKFMSNFETVDPAPQAFLEAGPDHVVVPVEGSAKTKSGNDISEPSIWLYELKGGKITRAQFYGDTAALNEALG